MVYTTVLGRNLFNQSGLTLNKSIVQNKTAFILYIDGDITRF